MSWVITGSEKTPVDPQFGSVSLLLHGDGANGSTTITDSSPSPTTVTAFGNAQISTAQSKFGGASIAFDGDGDYLRVANQSDLRFGTGDFTIEMWLYANTVSGTGRPINQDFNNDGSGAGNFVILRAGGDLLFYSAAATAWDNVSALSMGSISVNTWTHFSITRHSGIVYTWRNGVAVANVSGAGNLSNTGDITIASYGLGISGFYDGYIDDLRITKGVARYTANFTPPTAQFPDI